MIIGDKVYVAMPLELAVDGRGVVMEGTLVLVTDSGEVIVDQGNIGMHTYGGRLSNSRAFSTSAEAWKHCANTLARRAALLMQAAAECVDNA